MFPQPNVHPGNCWAFQGSTGFLVIRLSMSILPTAFSLEHIPKALAPSGTLRSAPRDFRVYVSLAVYEFLCRLGVLSWVCLSGSGWRQSGARDASGLVHIPGGRRSAADLSRHCESMLAPRCVISPAVNWKEKKISPYLFNFGMITSSDLFAMSIVIRTQAKANYYFDGILIPRNYVKVSWGVSFRHLGPSLDL